jgi:hypothetical protein
MCLLCALHLGNQRLTSKWWITCLFRLTYRLCWLSGLQNWKGSGFKQRLIVCVLPVTVRLVPNAVRRNLIRTHRFRTANKILPPLRNFRLLKPLTSFGGKVEFRGTEFNKDWSRPSSDIWQEYFIFQGPMCPATDTWLVIGRGIAQCWAC